MVSATSVLFAALAAVVSAAPTCKKVVTPTLPQTGGPTQLSPPAASLVLKKIAVGHGIQNYTCSSTAANASATGALAVLYDVTSFYPGTEKTGISQPVWDHLPSDLLWRTPLPLNKLSGSQFGADLTNPFPAPADLRLPGLSTLKFLGHHFFDSAGVPTFDLSAAGLKAVVKKTEQVDAPSNADKGLTGSGAVQWLQLIDNGAGKSVGVSVVYRVLTAGGNPEACSVAGAGSQSVPYAAYYWFFG
ncbi:66dc3f2b-ac7a-4d02-9e8d-36cfa77808f6 [Thermothielavioides terrestris]|uniref:Malate dehydrogenase n=2 Tax=Thermothielavioides terrestris TaxID=2587410 RepID=G2QTX8_THETT|nr:uncharacterized protein THITE_2109170 [Thermothielavioides terrestris NRRL 8126]AEO63637.1 hypothetical protein THITE_2109170 [Thermothielavioides terrestris NRRL 8126]SPQ20867.1 66dc3f2b-ac7a-4d02-9e8d-36cfa77808f6 [Thermothielavioides terrestris]